MIHLYHGTTLIAIEQMMKDGKLIPNKLNSSDAINAGYNPDDYYGYLFLTNCLSNAIHYSTMAIANNHRSPLHNESWGNLCIVLEIVLPEEHLLPDVHDAPNAKTWKESLVTCRSLRHKGEIPLSFVSQIKFCHYEFDDAVVSSTPSNWEETLLKYGHLFDADHMHEVEVLLSENQTPLVI